MSLKLCSEALGGCSGCETALLNAGGGSLGLLTKFEIVHMPMLMDHKYCGWGEPERQIRIPEAGLGIISGGIRSERQLQVAEEVRERCTRIAAFGTCAGHGGIPSLRSLFEEEDLFNRYYQSAEGTDSARNPSQGIPRFLERTFALDEKIVVDFSLPGCPPHPDNITAFLEAILDGKSPDSSLLSVCDSCPAKREGKGAIRGIQRFFRNACYDPDKPLSEMRCLFEQGYLCMGPVTLAGCAGMKGGPPRCIEARVPCRGCHGPVQKGGNQLMGILNALASNEIDTGGLFDRLSSLRFPGAHSRLNRRCQ